MSVQNVSRSSAVITRSRAVRTGFALATVAVLATSGCAAGRDAQTQNQVPTQEGTNANVGTMALRGISIAPPPAGQISYRAGSAVRLSMVLVNNGTHDERLTNIVTSVARGWAAYRTEAQAEQVIAAQGSGQLPGSSGPSASTTPGATPSGSASPSGSSSTSASSSSSSSTSSSASTSSSSTSTSSSSGSAPASSTSSSPTSSVSSALPTPQTDVTIPLGQRVSFGVPDSQRVLLLRSSVGTIQSGTTIKVTFTFSRSGSVTVPVPVELSSDPSFSTISPVDSGDGGD